MAAPSIDLGSARKASGSADAEPTSPKDADVTATSPKVGGGLAARRKMNMQVAINKPDPTQKGDVEKMDGAPPGIKVIERFADFYELGKEVMPSTNTGMDVLFAIRKKDSVEVVVKTRQKADSFVSKNEETEWRRSTEMLLNLPSSDNIARIYEVMEDDKTYYIVMEKVEGMDLFEVLHSEGRLPLMMAKAILKQLLGGVKDLHDRGCIHKDLKLENIMVDKSPKSPKNPGCQSPKSPSSPGGKSRVWGALSKLSGSSPKNSTPLPGQVPEEPASPTVKLIDFDTVETFSPKNRSRSVVGTDQYIAQEAYAGHYSPASDIFSCGVIAYRLISGKFPFKSAMFDDKPGENWVGSPKMKSIQDRLKAFEIDWKIAPWPDESKARDLVEAMLRNKQDERPTASQCLSHTFFEVTGHTPGLPKNTWGPRK